MTLLKLHRLMRDKKQGQVAKDLGISQSQYSKYEKGCVIPNIFKAVKIADYFDMDVGLVFPKYSLN